MVLLSGSDFNSLTANQACGNTYFDAYQSGSTGNTFVDNTFCTTFGI